MTATNHMLTGAVVAMTLQDPLFVVPVAFASHFVLDMIPHFGVNEADSVRRNKNPLFRYILAVDVSLALVLLVAVPLLAHHAVLWWVVVIGMLAAWAPDLVWTIHFLQQRLKNDFTNKKGRLSRFHQKIQWFERPPGLVVELAWFGAMSAFIGLLVTTTHL